MSVARQIAVAENAASHGDWSAASETLRLIVESTPDALIEVAPGHYVRALNHVDGLIGRWPAVGLQAYRARVDGTAAQQLEAAVAEADLARLQSLADRFAHSSIGTTAFWQLGRAFWQRGDLDRARNAWERLAEKQVSQPALDGEAGRANVLAALVLCSIFEGDRTRAMRECDVFRDAFPKAHGQVGGREGILADLLVSEIERSRTDPTRSGPSEFFAQRHKEEESTWEGIGLLQWASFAGSPMRKPDPRGEANVLPVADNDRVYLVEPTRIRALRLEDGGPAWPTGRSDDEGTIYQRPPMLMLDQDSAGLSTLSGTLASGRLFAVAGRTVSAAPGDAFPYLAPPIVALESAAEGRLLWSQGPEHPLAQQGWSAAGRPVARGLTVWTPLQRTVAPFDIGVAKLRADDGRLEWTVPVCTPFSGGPSNVIRYDSCWLTHGVRDVYLSTNSGALAAVDAESGTIRWIDAAVGRELTNREWNHRDHNRSSPPISWQGLVLLAPRGSGSVIAWDARNGTRLWEARLNERGLQLCGVSNGQVIATGRKIWSLDAETGKVSWRFGFEDEDGAGAGPAAISGSRLVWSTRRELFLMDVPSGGLLDRLDLRQQYGLTGGSLLAVGDRLVLSNAEQLAVLEMVSGK